MNQFLQISLFFLLFPIKSVFLQSCPRGWIPTSTDRGVVGCIPCPHGFFCKIGNRYPVLCSPGTYSLEGSERCCPRNMTCPIGFAVNANDDCSCSMIGCKSSLSDLEKNQGHEKVLVYDKHRNWILCKDERDLTSCKYSRCSDMRMIQYEESCICTRSTKCMDSNLNTQYWYSSFENSFQCVSII